MLSQAQLRENAGLFQGISAEESAQICSVVFDSLQFQTHLPTLLAGLEISDPGTRQTIADTLFCFIQKLMQSRSANADSAELLQGMGISPGHSLAMASVVDSRLGPLCKDLASRSSGDRLLDLEWRFGLTAASNSGAGAPFVQMRISFEKLEPVSVEMGILEFYEFASDIKNIQQQMSNTLGL
jgi:hypothetical protein